MKKRIALLLNFILLAGCLLFLFYHPALSGPISYVVGTEGKLAKIENTCRQAEEPFFTELAFSGEKLAFDKNTSAFYLPLNMEEEAWETGTLTSLAPDVELLFAEDFTKLDKQEVIREGRAFRFLAVRGTEYQECFLIVTGLPIIAIETEENAATEASGGTAQCWDTETKRDILGMTHGKMKKPTITQSFEPCELDSGDAAQVKLWNLAVKDQNAHALAAQDMLIVHFYAGQNFAERYESCMIEITGLGGEGGGDIGMPINVTYGGERTLGTATKAADGTVTFT